MQFTRTDIPDVVLIEPVVHGDDRGYFAETYRKDESEAFLGFTVAFCQDNESKSARAVLRGLHFQLPPFAQTKLVRVIQGAVLDVAVDIRRGSPTFGRYVAVELSGENKKQLLVPRGFAHGFLVLTDETVFSYKVDNYYSRESERGVAFDDPDIGIDWHWPQEALLLSEKDRKQPRLKDAKELFDFDVKYY